VLARETIAADLPQPVADRVFHIRSGLNGTPPTQLKRTLVGRGTQPPDSSPAPITGVAGPGDVTVPFWSARLAQTLDAQIYELAQAGDHGGLAEHPETLSVVRKLVEKGTLPGSAAVATAVAALPAVTIGTPKAS